MPPKNTLLNMFLLPPSHMGFASAVYDDPFGEHPETELPEPPPIQRATISTETGAEVSIDFPDSQVVDVTILGQAVVNIEIATLPKPAPVNVSIFSVILK